jgi:hypothetical protein
MEWHHLIIALIVIAGYVIKHIVSTQQEAAEQRAKDAAAREKIGGTPLAAQRERRSGGPAQAVAANDDEEVARARTAMDRRVEEAVELRRGREEKGEAENTVVVARIPRHIPMTLPTVVVATVPRYQPPPHDRAQPEVSQIPRSELPRTVPPAPRKTPAVAIKVVPAAGRLKANVAAVANTMQLVGEAPASSAPGASPAVRQALELLKDRQSLTTAFVLREILDRPVSMRRRRR